MAAATVQVAGREQGRSLREPMAPMQRLCHRRHHHMGETRGAAREAPSTSAEAVSSGAHLCRASAVRLTVWCRSLLFNGNGYTVYDDSDGRMVFRVDNYAHNWREEAHLMDSSGNVLLTLRRSRKKLSITDSWEVYEGDRDVLSRAAGQQRPLFRVTKALGIPCCTVTPVSSHDEQEAASAPAYRMSWSRQHEWSQIFAGPAGTPPVAEVSRKFSSGARGEMLGRDVLSMRVQAGTDPALVMALVMITDAMR